MSSFFYILLIAVSLITIANASSYPTGDDITKGPFKQPTSILPDEDDEECDCEDEDSTDAMPTSPRANGYPSAKGGPASTKGPPNNGGGSDNGGSSTVTGSVELRDKWGTGANCILVFKNNGNTKACGVKFELTLGKNQIIGSIWNVKKVSEKIYELPSYISLDAGVENRDVGIVVNGDPSSLPSIKILGQEECKY
ncbi:hypothetical protein ACQ4LE_007055 [Meloidogyne hapla]|uniref:CBM49 domain-containing protein n=1 Tax=Meloidogyne hapla TaxID=6305 RepID=A0A1I8BPH0_MELHA